MNLSVISSIKISKPVRSFIVLVIFLCAMIVFSYTTLLPQNETLNSLRTQYDADLIKLEIARIEYMTLPEIEEERKRLELKYQQLRKNLPDKGNIPDIIKHLTEELGKLDIKLTSLIPEIKEASRKERVRETTIDIIMKSSYVTLGNYLGAIENLPLLFKVRDVVIEKAEKGNLLTVSLVLVTYDLTHFP